MDANAHRCCAYRCFRFNSSNLFDYKYISCAEKKKKKKKKKEKHARTLYRRRNIDYNCDY